MNLDALKALLLINMAANVSGGEVIMTVGESLLFVLEVYEQAQVEKSFIDRLNQLYLEGIKTEEDSEFLKAIRTVFADKNYTITTEPKAINEDPTRRYFETHLAYHILQNNAAILDGDESEQFSQNLKRHLFSLPGLDPAHLIKADKILSGEMDASIMNKYEMEYAELISRLLKKEFHRLSDSACKNLYEMACSTILSTLNTQLDKSMPVDIYDDSVFTMGMDGRGRTIKAANDEVRTAAKGLMKSTSPLPRYNDLVNPVEDHTNYMKVNGDMRSPFKRSADQADFMLESSWTQHLFSRQTQLYSNGISSTTLAQIRNIMLQKRLGNSHYRDNFKQYMTTFSGLMVYNSGGHSFFEIFEVLKLPSCRELMDGESDMLEALAENKLMYQWLCCDQKDAFDKAIQSTLKYSHILLNKKIVHAEFNKRNGPTLKDEPEQRNLHLAVNQKDAAEFGAIIKELDINAINSPNHKKWTLLMIASQLGKTEQVKQLIAAGAKVKKQVEGLSSLELAIKSQRLATVKELLAAGAIVKRNDISALGLKERSPALYLACRQPDMGILKLILEHEKFTVRDKKEALLTSLKVENLAAIILLNQSITDEEKSAYFSVNYKSELLNEAAKLGNKELIQGIMALEFCPTSEQIDFDLLLKTATEKGYFPVVKQLLDKKKSMNKHDEEGTKQLSTVKNRNPHPLRFFANGETATNDSELLEQKRIR